MLVVLGAAVNSAFHERMTSQRVFSCRVSWFNFRVAALANKFSLHGVNLLCDVWVKFLFASAPVQINSRRYMWMVENLMVKLCRCVDLYASFKNMGRLCTHSHWQRVFFCMCSDPCTFKVCLVKLTSSIFIYYIWLCIVKKKIFYTNKCIFF